MVKPKTIVSFFKKKNIGNSGSSTPSLVFDSTSVLEQRPHKSPRIENKEVHTTSLERDPGLRPLMWDYPINQRDEIQRKYITELGPYQHILSEYPYSGPETHRRRFQASWFKLFTWLEYSPSKDAAYCFPCYLFTNKTSEHPRTNAFVVEGFRTWRKVNSGKDCAFLTHVGKSPSSPHNVAIKCCEDLKNQSRHIDTIIDKQ
ncbi:DUF4371 domain-containing protein, partial [Cephalotus follicularis]